MLTIEDADKQVQTYVNDWVYFAEDALGVSLDEEQKAILRAVQDHKMVSVASGTARGKDFISAVCAICFLYLTPKFDKEGNLIENTKIALTAPTGRQVQNIMIPEVSRIFRRAKQRGLSLPGKLLTNGIRTESEEWFLTGFKSDDTNTEAWTGFHAVNTMFIVTEASGISETVFEAVEGNLQNNSRMLIVFNPNRSTGYAAQSQKSKRWKSFRLNSLTAPNVVHKKMIIPGQVDYNWVIDKIDLWCDKIEESEVLEEEDDFKFEGQWYRPNDTFRVKVLGKFPKTSEDVLIPEQWIEKANENKVEAHGDDVLGVDVAGMGRDDTSMWHRKGNKVISIKTYNSGGKANHMETAGKVIAWLNQFPKGIASIDTIGEGAGVYSRLVELGYENRVVSCKFSESAKGLTDVTGIYEFQNLKAYLFWAVRDWLNPKNGEVHLPANASFVEEGTNILWEFKSNGNIAIEPKEKTKKRIGRSTDNFDALALTFVPAKSIGLSVDEVAGVI